MTEKNGNKVIGEKIKSKILELKRIESLLGSLPIENWNAKELQSKVTDPNVKEDFMQLETQTEVLFTEICNHLLEKKFTPSEVAHAINHELSYKNSLKYCNEEEVIEAVGKK